MAAYVSSNATVTASSDGPVLGVINKRLRALRKKYNRILQMEESVSQGMPLNKEQEEVFRSKPAVSALIDELEKLRQPLSSAVSEEISLALQCQTISPQQATSQHQRETTQVQEQHSDEPRYRGVEDLLKLLYIGSLFDVKSHNDFTSIMLTRTHERGCCLTYDYVTDDASDLLSEKDLDSISMLGGLLTSRPADSCLSHQNALYRCIHHAKLWLSHSDQLIDPTVAVSYAELRCRLKKIMDLEYFTIMPEMKAPAKLAAATVGAYASSQAEDSIGRYEQKEEDASNIQEFETSQLSAADELHKNEHEIENGTEDVPVQQENGKLQEDVEHNQRDIEPSDQQYVPRRTYQNQRGGQSNGGGRRGYSNGRGGRGGGRRGSAYHQNGRSQYYDQSDNYYPRNYYNSRGRGGRGGGHAYNNHRSAVQNGSYVAADVGVAS
ncbi:hypothetical protein F3Y22_tig00111005pilonHSYRG00139 [Hibiscus syriacus]|uniref:Glycine-rich protein n=1 Tax=Hibiscus syriacus TaxID=106335 RepID=A0A6A2Z7Q4_HIBSY|nr:uncharacterized protein LOC120149424 [Hibiscus syriacus]KAE8688004.1 hypothetical protein F3Y22_tig00111005pilonHSYRG00139 [Hibiscus syriacus]